MKPLEGLALVSVAVFMASLDLYIVNIAFPDIEGVVRGTRSPASPGS